MNLLHGNKKYLLKTLGCKANFHDTQRIEAELLKQGYLPADENDQDVELCVVNSCTVTDEADKQSIKTSNWLKKKHPQAKLVFTGCGAEVDPIGLSKVKSIDYIVGNQNKNQFFNILNQNSSPVDTKILGTLTPYKDLASQHPMDREWPLPETQSIDFSEGSQQTERTRAFIKIQEGCNSFCTYCIIPYGRGPSRSVSIDSVLEQIKSLSQQGFEEVVITGTNIGEFGVDFNSSFDALMTRISDLKIPLRVRLSSLDPSEISDKIFSLIELDQSICPHFHVSLQHTENKILKLMKRKYGNQEVRSCLNKIQSLSQKIRQPIFVGMDVITGFPGETDEDFESMLNSLNDLYWTRLHVFPYSERTGTPATKLKGIVPVSIRKLRAKKLRELSLKRQQDFYHQYFSFSDQLIDQKKKSIPDVLFEGIVEKGLDPNRFWVSGYSRNYMRFLVPFGTKEKAKSVQNKILAVRPLSVIVDPKSAEVSYLGEIDVQMR